MADNQRILAEELEAHGAAVNLGDYRSVCSDNLVSAVNRLRSSDAELSAMSSAAYAVMANHVDVAEVIGTYV